MAYESIHLRGYDPRTSSGKPGIQFFIRHVWSSMRHRTLQLVFQVNLSASGDMLRSAHEEANKSASAASPFLTSISIHSQAMSTRGAGNVYYRVCFRCFFSDLGSTPSCRLLDPHGYANAHPRERTLEPPSRVRRAVRGVCRSITHRVNQSSHYVSRPPKCGVLLNK